MKSVALTCKGLDFLLNGLISTGLAMALIFMSAGCAAEHSRCEPVDTRLVLGVGRALDMKNTCMFLQPNYFVLLECILSQMQGETDLGHCSQMGC